MQQTMRCDDSSWSDNEQWPASPGNQHDRPEFWDNGNLLTDGRSIMKHLKIFTAILFLTGLNLALAESVLEFEDPWSPLAPPGRTMAGFVTLHNPGDSDITLVNATSPQFERVEIHTMSMDDGVMRMRRLEELVVGAGKKVILQPGGRHLMLFEPSQTFEDGDTIDLELIDSEGARHNLALKVRPRD